MTSGRNKTILKKNKQIHPYQSRNFTTWVLNNIWQQLAFILQILLEHRNYILWIMQKSMAWSQLLVQRKAWHRKVLIQGSEVQMVQHVTNPNAHWLGNGSKIQLSQRPSFFVEFGSKDKMLHWQSRLWIGWMTGNSFLY